MTVPSRKRPSASLIRGKRNFSPDARRAANASARRICEGAIPNMIATPDPNASQRAIRNKLDSEEYIEMNSQYRKVRIESYRSLVAQSFDRIKTRRAAGRPDAEKQSNSDGH